MMMNQQQEIDLSDGDDDYQDNQNQYQQQQQQQNNEPPMADLLSMENSNNKQPAQQNNQYQQQMYDQKAYESDGGEAEFSDDAISNNGVAKNLGDAGVMKFSENKNVFEVSAFAQNDEEDKNQQEQQQNFNDLNNQQQMQQLDVDAVFDNNQNQQPVQQQQQQNNGGGLHPDISAICEMFPDESPEKIESIYAQVGRKKELVIEALMNPEVYKAQLEAHQVAMAAQQQLNDEDQEDANDLQDLVNGQEYMVEIDANDQDAVLAAKMQQAEIKRERQRQTKIEQKKQMKAMQQAQMMQMQQQQMMQHQMNSNPQQNVYELQQNSEHVYNPSQMEKRSIAMQQNSEYGSHISEDALAKQRKEQKQQKQSGSFMSFFKCCTSAKPKKDKAKQKSTIMKNGAQQAEDRGNPSPQQNQGIQRRSSQPQNQDSEVEEL